MLGHEGERGKTTLLMTRILGQLCIYDCHARIFAPRIHEHHELVTLVQAAHLFRKDGTRIVPAAYNAGLQAWSACAHRLPAKERDSKLARMLFDHAQLAGLGIDDVVVDVRMPDAPGWSVRLTRIEHNRLRRLLLNTHPSNCVRRR